MLESNFVMSNKYLFLFSIKHHKQTKLIQFLEAKFKGKRIFMKTMNSPFMTF